MSRPAETHHVLTRMRQTIGLGRQQLAGYLGCSRSYVEQIERGVKPLTQPLAVKLCLAFGVSIRWLQANDPDDEPFTVDGYPFTRAEADRWEAWQAERPADPSEVREYLMARPLLSAARRPMGPRAEPTWSLDPGMEMLPQTDAPTGLVRSVQQDLARTVLRRRLEDLDLILEQLKEAIAADADPMLRWWQARRTLLGLLAPYPKKTAGGRRPRDSQAGDGKQIGNGGKRKKGGRKR